jgi:hypothetical protein
MADYTIKNLREVDDMAPWCSMEAVGQSSTTMSSSCVAWTRYALGHRSPARFRPGRTDSSSWPSARPP